ncbi:VOC family protein [Rhodobacter sp. Har01]|uniref:VOC family protein n=1 Tax=Rhodobacter sp. Har01 TaxID=2883999 RepID=UPI001D0975F0|nr:VOC family protein [Rhodobacter sp. Har01]MCB6179737.1 VOC family protein [Rhodobacter sp. Har01]
MGRLIVFTRKIDEMAAFCCRHLGFEDLRLEGDRIVELRPKGEGIGLLLHPAAKGQKEGQSLVKLVFDVKDVEGLCDTARERGLHFGSIHHASGCLFANANDTCNNSVSVSSRAFLTVSRDPVSRDAPG